MLVTHNKYEYYILRLVKIYTLSTEFDTLMVVQNIKLHARHTLTKRQINHKNNISPVTTLGSLAIQIIRFSYNLGPMRNFSDSMTE